MKGKDYSGHRKCNVDGCSKYAVKDGYCTRCYNKAHGIEKHVGRNPNKKRGHPTKAVIPATSDYCRLKKDSGQVGMTKSKGNSDYDGVILKLMNAKSDAQQEIIEIENAIKVLKKYV